MIMDEGLPENFNVFINQIPGTNPPVDQLAWRIPALFLIENSVHQWAGDTHCFKPHTEQVKAWLGKYPETIIADTGDGSEKNFTYLQNYHATAYVKYNTFHYDHMRHYKNKMAKYPACQDYPVLAEYTQSKNERRSRVRGELLKMKKLAHERLLSSRGKEVRSQSPIEKEAVYDRLIHNWRWIKVFPYRCR